MPLPATRRPAFDHAKLAEALTKATEKPHEATRLPIERIEIADDGTVRFEAHGKAWRYDTGADALGPGRAARPLPARAARRGRGGRRSGRSPRSTGIARRQDVTFIKDHNLYLRDKKTGEEFAL